MPNFVIAFFCCLLSLLAILVLQYLMFTKVLFLHPPTKKNSIHASVMFLTKLANTSLLNQLMHGLLGFTMGSLWRYVVSLLCLFISECLFVKSESLKQM